MTDRTVATKQRLDADIAALTEGAAAWRARDLGSRIALLKQTHAAIAAAADEWVEAAVHAKGTPRGAPEGEEWLSGPYAVLAGFAAVIESLESIRRGELPADALKAGTAPGGRTTFRVLPTNLYEVSLFHGFTADLWLTPGVSATQARRTAGLGATQVGHSGGVGLVLGAGNVSAIGPLDVLYEVIAHNRVCVLKLNPTFAGLLPAYEKAFAPLIEAAVLRVVDGGADVGAYLTGHTGIDHVHITGSQATHDTIVFGSPTDKSHRRLDKPITSELGGVSPIIVVPGNWSAADIRFQAENVVTQRLHNTGHNCIAGQALILAREWAQKDEFLAAVRQVMADLAPRAPWYPGADDRVTAAVTAYPNAETINGRLLVEVGADTSQDLLTTEYFAPVLGHIALPGSGVDFFAAAVDFANTRLYGSLGASIIVAPGDRRAMGAAFDRTLADLRYGTIGINVWSAIGFLIPGLSWGAYPGNTLGDVGSGIGIVHNAHLLDNVERSVVNAPFRPFPRSIRHGELALSPKPGWFVTAKTAKATAELLTRFSASPSALKLPGIFRQAFRG